MTLLALVYSIASFRTQRKSRARQEEFAAVGS